MTYTVFGGTLNLAQLSPIRNGIAIGSAVFANLSVMTTMHSQPTTVDRIFCYVWKLYEIDLLCNREYSCIVTLDYIRFLREGFPEVGLTFCDCWKYVQMRWRTVLF